MTRNLRRCIQRAGVELAVEIELVRTTIKRRKPRLRVEEVYWPVLSMKSWCSVLLDQYPQLLLGGFDLEDSTKWRSLFTWFWEGFRHYDPQHPIYHDNVVEDRSLAIPIFTHGDEGRGLRNQAFMVQSWQTVLSVDGPGETNNSGNHGSTFKFSMFLSLGKFQKI